MNSVTITLTADDLRDEATLRAALVIADKQQNQTMRRYIARLAPAECGVDDLLTSRLGNREMA